MKKILFFAVSFMLLCAPIAEAQMKVKWDGNSNINWKVKRCYVQNDKCILDLLVTNNTGSTIKSFMFDSFHTYPVHSMAYDDEGNKYPFCSPVGNSPSKKFSNEETMINGCTNYSGILKFELPAGLTVKARIVLNDFDEYASMLTLVNLGFGDQLYPGTLELRNVPVTRE